MSRRIKVLVYDGGTKSSGQALVNHIRTHYKTNRVDYVVNSHPDNDHASGLPLILEQMEIGELWMHRPWMYSNDILDYFQDGRITNNSLAERLKNKMTAAYKLEEIATNKDISIFEPFQGEKIGDFEVLSPEKNWYIHELISEFEKSPEQKKLEYPNLEEAYDSIKNEASSVIEWIAEYWNQENLGEDVTTSAENESSVVIFGKFDGRGILLTGDAGISALTKTHEYAVSKKLFLPDVLRFIQVPHHGSRNNVSTNVLDKIIGSRKRSNDGNSTKTAFVSASKDSTKHPHRVVINAFIRRGVKVIATQGRSKRHYYNMPRRAGWSSATPLKYSDKIEKWD